MMTDKKPKKLSRKRQASGKGILDSANQIWLAGLGAFAKAQQEGGKLFEGLIKDGLDLESTTRKATLAKVNVVRGAVEGTVGQVQAKAADSWGKLEQVFEDRVARALGVLGIPTSEDLQALTRQVEALQDTVDALEQGGVRPAPDQPTPDQATPDQKTSKSTVKKAVASGPVAASKKKATKKKVLRKKTTAKKSAD